MSAGMLLPFQPAHLSLSGHRAVPLLHRVQHLLPAHRHPPRRHRHPMGRPPHLPLVRLPPPESRPRRRMTGFPMWRDWPEKEMGGDVMVRQFLSLGVTTMKRSSLFFGQQNRDDCSRPFLGDISLWSGSMCFPSHRSIPWARVSPSGFRSARMPACQ